MCITISSFLRMYDRIIDAWHFVENNPILEDRPNVGNNFIDTYDDDDEFENDLSDDELVETSDDDADGERMVDTSTEFDLIFGDGGPVDVLENDDKTDSDRLSCKVVTDSRNASSDNVADADSKKSCVAETADGERYLTLDVNAKDDVFGMVNVKLMLKRLTVTIKD